MTKIIAMKIEEMQDEMGVRNGSSRKSHKYLSVGSPSSLGLEIILVESTPPVRTGGGGACCSRA